MRVQVSETELLGLGCCAEWSPPGLGSRSPAVSDIHKRFASVLTTRRSVEKFQKWKMVFSQPSIYIDQRRQFPPGPWVRTRPVLRRGRVHTLVDPTKFWQGDEIDNRYFCHVSWHFGHCIPFQPIKRLADLIVFRALPTVDSPCTLFTFTYLQRQTARRTTAILLY